MHDTSVCKAYAPKNITDKYGSLLLYIYLYVAMVVHQYPKNM